MQHKSYQTRKIVDLGNLLFLIYYSINTDFNPEDWEKIRKFYHSSDSLHIDLPDDDTKKKYEELSKIVGSSEAKIEKFEVKPMVQDKNYFLKPIQLSISDWDNIHIEISVIKNDVKTNPATLGYCFNDWLESL